MRRTLSTFLLLPALLWAGLSTPALANTIKILTFNIDRSNGLAENEMMNLAKYFKTHPDKTPDFILLQEVYSYDDEDPSRTSAAAVLAREMNYNVRYDTKGGLITPSEGSAILSRFPFVHFDSKSMMSAPVLDSLRLALLGEFIVPQIGRVRIVNVHLAYASYMGWFRKNQVEGTLDWIRERETDPETTARVTFFGGDFNAASDSDELSLIFDPPYSGSFNFQNFNGREPTYGSKKRHNKARLDQIYIAANPNEFRFIGESLLGKEGTQSDAPEIRFSDHVPVYHEYGFLDKYAQSETTDSPPSPSFLTSNSHLGTMGAGLAK